MTFCGTPRRVLFVSTLVHRLGGGSSFRCDLAWVQHEKYRSTRFPTMRMRNSHCQSSERNCERRKQSDTHAHALRTVESDTAGMPVDGMMQQ